MSRISRRAFHRLAGAAALVSSTARSAGPAGANERIRVGLIGCGMRGGAFWGLVDRMCDPDAERLAQALRGGKLSAAAGEGDFRRLLDDPDLDAVVIAAPDHWHAPAALLALDAGKHVYVEKPWSHNFRESQWLRRAAEGSKLVLQHGTQQRSRPFIADAIAELHRGLIGPVLAARAWNVQRRESIGHGKPSAAPAGVDYEQWLGPAPKVPFQANRFHSSWHWWHAFGTGDVGNDGAHELDYARWGLGVDALPEKVAATGGKFFFDDDQQFPDTAACSFEFAPDARCPRPRQLVFEMRLWSRNYPFNCDSGVEFYGEKGSLFLSKRGKLRLFGPKNETLRNVTADDDPGHVHFENFLAAIRGTAQANAGPREAHLSASLSHLANVAIRSGQTLLIDPATEEVSGGGDVAALLGRQYRSGGHWAIPQEAAT